MTSDRRRRQYVPLSVHFAAGHTGQKLQERHGLEGLGAWACFLAAAKRSPIQGSVEWYSEEDGWRQLQVKARPSFTFEEFVATLGRLHLAKTTKRGEVKTTSIRAWNEWNLTIKRQQDADKKSRKRAQNTGDNTSHSRGTEGEGEGDIGGFREKQVKTNPTRKHACHLCGATQRSAGELNDHLEYVHDLIGVTA